MDQTIPKIVVCGSIAIDRIMNFTGRYRDIIQPDKLHVLSVSTLLDKLEDSRGGVGANITSSLALLGEKPILLGSVGKDAEYYMESLKELGVNTEYLHYSDLPTASFNVITDSEDNQIGGFFEGAMSDSDSLTLAPWINQNVLVVIAADNPAAMNLHVSEARANNIRFAYDPGQQVNESKVLIDSGIDSAEIVFANDYEMSLICKRLNSTVDQLNQRIPVLVTTLGKSGSIINGNKVDRQIEIGIAKTEPVDPTGAGDAYRAGFLYAYTRNRDLKTCGQLGSTVASFIIERHGTQQSFSVSAVKDRYLQTFNEEIEL